MAFKKNNKAKSPGYATIWYQYCAIRREGACSLTAKRQGQGKGATEKARTEGFEQADGGGQQSKEVGRKRKDQQDREIEPRRVKSYYYFNTVRSLLREALRGARTPKQISRTTENRTSASPISSKISLKFGVAGLVGNARLRDSRTG